MDNTENVVTFRCSDALLEEIDTATDRSRFDTRAAFLRWHLEETIGEAIRADTATNRTALAQRIDELETDLSDVRSRLEEIERESNQNESQRIAPAVQSESDETAHVYRDALEGWSPGRSDTDREKRREIGETALQWLAEQRTAQRKGTFVSALYDRTALEEQGEKTWWERVVRPSLSTAAENGYVDDDGRTYEWLGE